MNLHISQLLESGQIVKRGPGVQTLGACVHAAGALEVRDRGYIATQNLFSSLLTVGNDAELLATVNVAGNGSLGHRSIINGNAFLEGLIQLGANSQVTGALQQNSTLAPLVIDERTVTAGTQPVTVPHDTTQPIAPGAYGAVLVQDRATALLSSGTYNVTSFEVQDAVLVVDASAGPVVVNVVGSVRFGDRAEVTVSGENSLSVYSNATDVVRVGNDAKLPATLTVPSGRVIVSSRALVTGCIAADEILLEPDARVEAP
jgi:hypothetical protein